MLDANKLSEALYIVDRKYNEIYTTCNPKDAQEEIEKAGTYYMTCLRREEELAETLPKDAEYWRNIADKSADKLAAGFDAVTWDEYKKRERRVHLTGEPEETTKEVFDERLNVLPPLCWTTHRGVEMFCIRELYSGTLTDQYAHDHETGKYWHKMVDCADRNTWIVNFLREDLRENVKDLIA